jgi:hypothetical protein
MDNGMGYRSTPETYQGSALKPYFEFCEDECLPPLAATTPTIARYIAWIRERGTIKATSLHPCFSIVNVFFTNHGAKLVAPCDLVEKVRRGVKLRVLVAEYRQYDG